MHPQSITKRLEKASYHGKYVRVCWLILFLATETSKFSIQLVLVISSPLKPRLGKEEKESHMFWYIQTGFYLCLIWVRSA